MNEEVTVDARISFARAFGILPDEQLAMEAYFNSITIDENVVDMLGSIRENNLLYPSQIINVW